MNSQILAAKEVAAQWAQEALEKDTATVMDATEITDEVIQAYTEALEQVAATCGEIEAETIATDVEALLKQAQLHQRKTEHEMDQIEHEEFKMDKKCRPENINIDYFVNRLKVKYGSAACGSSLLQTAHQDVADRLSITLNRHAREEAAEEAEEEAAMEEFEGSEGALIDSSARGYHNYTGFSLGTFLACKTTKRSCVKFRADMITCICVKPADPLKLKFSLGAAIKDCGQGLDGAIATFSVNLKLLLCLGIPGLAHPLQLINADCMDLAGVKYFPFIGRLTVGDVTNFGEYWLTGEARFKFNFNFVVHDLTKAVTEYCNVKHISRSDWAWHWIYMASSKSHDEICRIFPKCPSCYVSKKEQECVDWFDDQRVARKELKVVIDEMYHEAYDCWWDCAPTGTSGGTTRLTIGTSAELP
ncbi:unnamed protein product [Symbiodinium sp. CCMP2456]|nr:unnamed protein product [Symbiodinium sp. CCMP2456]